MKYALRYVENDRVFRTAWQERRNIVDLALFVEEQGNEILTFLVKDEETGMVSEVPATRRPVRPAGGIHISETMVGTPTLRIRHIRKNPRL